MSKMTIFNPLEGIEHSCTYSKTVQSQVVWKLSLNLCIHWPAILQPIIIPQIITLIKVDKVKWPPLRQKEVAIGNENDKAMNWPF